MVPTIGAVVVGTALMTTSEEATEVQPVTVEVTVKLYVAAGAKPFIVVVGPLPVMPPGFIVQAPDGKPLKATLPVGTVQVGWVMIPTIGAVVVGTALITTFAEATEVHPVTVEVTV
jgi:hypothetical protein